MRVFALARACLYEMSKYIYIYIYVHVLPCIYIYICILLIHKREMDNEVAIAAVTRMQQLRAALEAERAEKHS